MFLSDAAALDLQACIALGKIPSISFSESLKLYSMLSSYSSQKGNLQSNPRNKCNIIDLIKKTGTYKKELKTCLLKETVNDSLKKVLLFDQNK